MDIEKALAHHVPSFSDEDLACLYRALRFLVYVYGQYGIAELGDVLQACIPVELEICKRFCGVLDS